ncbi:MAG TPA: hypothetical protein VKR61_05725, partial [Bryobacteraceae bacterium]|nr:hypothetical protein [Bryobacteraceae bacterium]
MEWERKRQKRDEDLDEEIAHDLMLDAEERAQDGIPRENAAQDSRRDFGNVLSAKEAARAAW